MFQVLLEACMPTEEERSEPLSLLSDLKEVQALICSYIHEAFIAEPNLAKLVHFQVKQSPGNQTGLSRLT